MTQFVIEQLSSDVALRERAARPWDHVIVLEQIAWGAGETRWYFARTLADLKETFSLLQWGSLVSFFFDSFFSISQPSENALGYIDESILGKTELVVGFWPAAGVKCDVVLLAPTESVEEFFDLQSNGGLLFWGDWPDAGPDSERVITRVLVDDDGVLRGHPY